MSLRSEMRSHVRTNDGWSPEQLAASFVKARTKDELVPMLIEEFAHMLRNDTREMERALAAMAVGARPITRADTIRLLGDLAPMLNRSYAVGDGTSYLARDMTVAHWEARQAMLMGQLRGIVQSIRACRRAVDLIRAFGVSTLGEIEAVTED